MPDITKDPNVRRTIEDQSPAVYRNGVEYQKLVTVLADTFQAIQNDTDALVYGRFLTAATDAQLDQWGAVVDLPRQGWSDDRYRALLLGTFLILRSTGTINELLDILRALADTSEAHLWEYVPDEIAMSFTGDLFGTDPGWAQLVPIYLRRAKALSKRLEHVIQVESDTFILDTAGRGLDDGILAIDLGGAYH